MGTLSLCQIHKYGERKGDKNIFFISQPIGKFVLNFDITYEIIQFLYLHRHSTLEDFVDSPSGMTGHSALGKGSRELQPNL